MGIELIFVLIWLLIIVFGGNKGGEARGMIMDAVQKIGTDMKASQEQHSAPPVQPSNILDDMPVEREIHREHKATPWREDLETQPSSTRRIKPLEGLSLEETESHKAHLDHYRGAPKNSVTKHRKFIGGGTVRDAYLFKELIDKPVALKD